jgi:aminoglycoside phosphotransferase (APT) family kinase protein
MRLPLLTADTAANYLRERGLATVDHGVPLRVRDLSRRNHNLAVEIDGRACWLIKQIQYDTPEVVASLAREAQCYQAAEGDGPLASLRALMPRCAHFDSVHSILVIAFLDGVNAAEAHSRVGPFESRVAEELGRVLGRLQEATPLDSFPADLPWVLRPLDSQWRASARSRFLAFFHAQSAIADALEQLRGSWQRNMFVHGDARPENFVFVRPFDAKLVDWELADRGDAAWDCANVMQYYWSQWASTLAPTPEAWDALAGALQSFWAAYGNRSRNSFDRATRFTGARLIQTAYEQFASSGAWSPPVERTARLACLLLTKTDEALRGFEAHNDGA